MTEPTEEDYETGRALAGMAEADGAVSDGADVPWMIAHEIVKARAEGYDAGYAAGHADGYTDHRLDVKAGIA